MIRWGKRGGTQDNGGGCFSVAVLLLAVAVALLLAGCPAP